MSSRKRAHAEMEDSEAPKAPSTLERLRNMWEFACLAQYIFIFGDAVKINKNFDIEVHLNHRLRNLINHHWAPAELLQVSFLLTYVL